VEAPAFYVVRAGAEVRTAPSATAPVVETLRVRDGVRVLDADSTAGDAPWHLVQTQNRRGYVAASALSNVWIRIDKSERTVYVYRGADLVRTLPADVSMGEGDKVRRAGLDEPDHWRTPEGTFFVTRRNAASSYYRAFVISYPSPVHALRGLDAGLITEAEYQAIVLAHQEGREPPQGTSLGGMIELHGSGSGRRTAWTRGCVALRNVHMDELWEYVEVGTPVVIEE
jgi:murein L,D-transpeptidase YafK